MPAGRNKSTTPTSKRPRAPKAARGGTGQTRRRATDAAEGIPHTLRGLREVTDALHYVHQSFADVLLKLPRAEDFEPLLAPLREFARVSPALVEAFRGVIETTRALAPAGEPEAPGASAAPALDGGRVDEALRHVDAAREALRQALTELPSDAAYRPVARQLRELASVSPSLMDWLKEVPKLTTPLSASVAALRRAVCDLETARDLLTEDVPTPAPKPH